MDRYERNIKQIEDADKVSSKIYFLDKTMEECVELIQICNKVKELEEEGINWEGTTWEDNFYEEIADNINCVAEYLPRLFDLDLDRIRRIKVEKVDRGYKRGVE